MQGNSWLGTENKILCSPAGLIQLITLDYSFIVITNSQAESPDPVIKID